MKTHQRLTLTLLVIAFLLLISGCAKPNAQQAEDPTAPAVSEKETSKEGDTQVPRQYIVKASEAADFDAEYDEAVQVVSDPLEPWNRFWFYFNDYLHSIVWRPLGKGYNAVIPEPVRIGVKNVFHNLLFPVRFVNCLLQGKFKGAGVEMSRFIGNTAFGGLGLYRPFDKKKGIADPDEEDFGQTLGAWGLGNGVYLVWPVLGPSTVRDTVGMAGDYFLDPVTYISPPFTDWTPWYVSSALKAGSTFNEMSFRLDEYDEFKRSAVEPYSAMRNAYIQHRQEKVEK